ncbi:MAG: ammonium transporter, partial [Gammaproteobacteria bacterium]
IVVFSIVSLDKLRIDDPVGAISAHGSVGIWGLLAVPLSSDVSLMSQLIGIGTIFAWVFGTSLILWGILKATMGIRVSEQEEHDGLDFAECGVHAYPEFTTGEEV